MLYYAHSQTAIALTVLYHLYPQTLQHDGHTRHLNIMLFDQTDSYWRVFYKRFNTLSRYSSTAIVLWQSECENHCNSVKTAVAIR